MSSINTNVTAMAAIRSLSMINNNMQTTQARVESGLRINKANDDPAVFSIAQTMRADLKGLTAVRDGLAFGKATLTVARDAATKISNELATLKQTVTQGQQQGLDKATMNEQVRNILANIRSFAETATFNGVNVLNNSATGDRELRVLRDVTGRTINVANQGVISDAASGSRLLNLDNLDVDQGGIRITPSATLDPYDGNFVAIRLGSGTAEDPFRELVFEFNQSNDRTGTGYDADDERLLSQQSTPQRQVIAVNIGTNSNQYAPGNEMGRLVEAMQANGIGARLNQDGTIDIFGANVSGIRVEINEGAEDGTETTEAENEFQASLVRTTLNGETVWRQATYAAPTGPGVGTFTVVDGTAPVQARLSVIGADSVTDLDPGTTGNQFGYRNVSSAIATVDEAISTVNSIVAELGAKLTQVEGQQDFTKQLTDSIREGLGALVDADLAEESARLTSLQTKQQLAIQSLSIANQQGQALLGLFR